jgi:transcription initiation factor TFIID subunit 5
MPPKSRPPTLAAPQQRHDVPANHGSQLSDFQVTDYLKKKGFTKTEAVFRQETAYLGPDGRPAQRNDDPGPKKYLKAFLLLRNWIENNLDIYKVRFVSMFQSRDN